MIYTQEIWYILYFNKKFKDLKKVCKYFKEDVLLHPSFMSKCDDDVCGCKFKAEITVYSGGKHHMYVRIIYTLHEGLHKNLIPKDLQKFMNDNYINVSKKGVPFTPHDNESSGVIIYGKETSRKGVEFIQIFQQLSEAKIDEIKARPNIKKTSKLWWRD